MFRYYGHQSIFPLSVIIGKTNIKLNISIYILHTLLHTLAMLILRRICQTIKIRYLLIISFFLTTFTFD